MSDVRLGVVGGMGPLAGVYFQELIVRATPATKDQDHIPVICFTNPLIPDRTESLAKDGGDSFVEEIVRSLRVLATAGATQAVIPCHTAHARFRDIESQSPLSLLNLIDVTLEKVIGQYGKEKPIGILATSGTLNAEVYPSSRLGKELRWVLPSEEERKKLM